VNLYELDAKKVAQELNSSPAGLTLAQATQQLEVNGPNVLDKGKKKSFGHRIWEQIKDPMIIVLIGAAIISGAFGETADMIIILLVVILNAVLGIAQEYKAEQAIDALQQMNAPHAKVRRDGVIDVVDTSQIVPGDVVLLEAGDFVPADLRLLDVATLKIEESALTGESVPVEKTANALAPRDGKDVPLGDRRNMAYMGTNVAYGRGEGVVVSTGMSTEMGKIAGKLADSEDGKTPLQQKLAGLSKVLSIAVLGICVFIFFLTVLQSGGFSGGHVFEAFLTAVSLAVAAIPEGLVVVVTVLLSIGVTRMSSRNAIIRKMTAVETLGSTEVICSDKTGTLTQNKMTVVEHFGDEDLLSTAMALCNDSGYDADGDLVGDPTETALVVWAESLGKKELSDQYPRIAEVPFDSERKMMSTLHQVSDGVRQFTKGAPDEVLAHCDWALIDGKVVEMTNVLRQQILDANKQMADKALRVLGGAYRDYPRLPEDLSDKAVEQQMTFVGLAGMIDPVRDEVKAAIGSCKSAGVRAVMITGDHRDTAVAIAKELGILHRPDQAITGAQLSQMSDEEFKNRIADIVVYARVQPEDKVRIVKAWKEKGKVTAMTGDGVNDAPAIKSADIGVGMGITGTDVTKNVADMVLSDDNFATIVYAVEEGRRIYENIRKAVQFLLASNLAEVIAILIATLAGWRLFAPIHILWINLITDTFPAMALGMEKAEPDSMKKPPRPAKESIFASGLGIGVIYQGVTVAVLTLLSFFIGAGQSHVTGMTMAFLTLSMCEVFHSFNMRSRNESLFSIKGQNKYLWGAALLAAMLTFAVIYIPGLNTVFQLTALSVADFFVAFGFAAAILPLVEIVKFFQRRITKSRLSA